MSVQVKRALRKTAVRRGLSVSAPIRVTKDLSEMGLNKRCAAIERGGSFIMIWITEPVQKIKESTAKRWTVVRRNKRRG